MRAKDTSMLWGDTQGRRSRDKGGRDRSDAVTSQRIPKTASNHRKLGKEKEGFPSPVSSVTQSCLTLWDPMDCSTPGLPVHHQLPELTQTHVLQVRDAIQPSHSLSSPSPPAFNLSWHQGLFQWVSSSHQVALLTLKKRDKKIPWPFSVS